MSTSMAQGLTCPACGGCHIQFRGEDVLPSGFVKRLHGCVACGLQFVHPLPTPDQLAGLYEDDSYFASDRCRGIGYQAYCTEREMIALVLRHLRRRLVGGRLLEVGCATGDFLEAARDAGFSVTGIEVNATAVARAREKGLEVHHGFFETVSPGLPVAGYRVLVLLDVLEHVLDPRAMLQECRRLLSPGGWLVVHTPNYAAPRHVKRPERIYTEGREHLFYFTPTSLRALLRSEGWDRVALSTRPPRFPESYHAPGLSWRQKAGKLAGWVYKRWVLHALQPLRWEAMLAIARRPPGR